ncbi:hypothetical protein ACTXQV_52215, partial [Klebsiella pneumoniae]
ARFLKEQGKVPAAGTDYRQYVTVPALRFGITAQDH